MTISPRSPAERLLTAVTAAFGGSAPERRYLAPGPTAAWDGDHLAVYLAAVQTNGQAQPSKHASSVQLPRGVYAVRILRCVPTVNDEGHAPSAETINDSAAGLLDDLGLLLTGVAAFLAASPQGVATLNGVDPLGPDGGLAGWQASVTYSPLA